MSDIGQFLFVIAATVAIGGAVGTVASKRPLRSAVALLIHIVSLAGLYLILHAHLLAALQLIVYAGAVVVLFVFVIMLIGPSSEAPRSTRGLLTRTISGTLMAIVTAATAFGLVGYGKEAVVIASCGSGGPECGQFGGVEAVGTVLYREALLPFEIVSLLLLVAIVGAVAVARGRNALELAELQKAKEAKEAELARVREREQRLAAEVSAHGGH